MTKFLQKRGQIAKRNMRTISRYSHISAHDREKEIKDRKKQDKTGQKHFFFHKNGSEQEKNGRVDKLPKLHKIKPTTVKAAEKNLETVRKEISAWIT